MPQNLHSSETRPFFQRQHISRIAYFRGGSNRHQASSVPLPAWENFEDNDLEPDNFAHTFNRQPRSNKLPSQTKRRGRVERMIS